ncbi:type II toxin-antitoxin system VapC family toxin [Echinicola sediminis]
MRAKDKTKTRLYDIYEEERLSVSTVTLFELLAGANTPQKREEIFLITDPIQKLDFTDAVALNAAEIYRQLKRNNRLIEFRDIFIAATCIVHDETLLTFNKKHFNRIKDLKIA